MPGLPFFPLSALAALPTAMRAPSSSISTALAVVATLGVRTTRARRTAVVALDDLPARLCRSWLDHHSRLFAE